MPIYEFQCPTCGSISEVTRSMDARNDPLFCDGAQTFDDIDARFDNFKHITVPMERVMSRLGVARVAGKRYA